MKKFLYPLLLLILSHSLKAQMIEKVESPADWVNPLMGTLTKQEVSNGNQYPNICMPWGMNSWTPQTGASTNKWLYTYDADKIRGFRQTHQASVWLGDWGTYSLMPIVGKPCFDEEKRESWFSHKTEIAKPYYYRVYLADHNVWAEFAPTERAAHFRFYFPEGDSSYVVVDALRNGSYIKIIPDQQTIVGYNKQNSRGASDKLTNYFVVKFNQPFTYTSSVKEGAMEPAQMQQTGDHVGAIVGFNTRKGIAVEALTASSFISMEQAVLNLREVEGKSFEQVKKEGRDRWNEVLGKIEVSGGDVNDIRTFYSCLYRSVLFPRNMSEINKDGEAIHYNPYNDRVMPGTIYVSTGFWDTFRALFPLLNLAYPSVSQKIQKGLEIVTDVNPFLPEWSNPGHIDCMIGNNSFSVVADAYLSGLRGYDIDKIYKAAQYSATHVHETKSSVGRLGYEYFNKIGYIPADADAGSSMARASSGFESSVARSLEYAYDDWCLLQLGKALKQPVEELDILKKRAQNYRNLFDPATSLMRPRLKDGEFETPFDPLAWGKSFREGNSYHYSWSVFHDIQGLVDLMGGKEKTIHMLDTILSMPPLFHLGFYRDVQHEMREMQIVGMGNYAHGNEPAQHMLYLYNYVGEPWKSQYWTRVAMKRLYTPYPDGYCGDEDNGQISAWYVFAAMGFYPVCPASGEYVLGSPLFKKISVNLENGKKIAIQAPNNSDENVYIGGLKLNGENDSRNYLNRQQLMKGATIVFDMQPQPNKKRGINKNDFPYSMSNE
ncbi:MAG: GH92 family glycosyl hydrolase [Bacteroidetes bacterium]|nr:GH92 family glycosyl hydrolase [Bacteroidota bacterium]